MTREEWLRALPHLTVTAEYFDRLPIIRRGCPVGSVGQRWRRETSDFEEATISDGPPIWLVGEIDLRPTREGRPVAVNWFLPIRQMGGNHVAGDLRHPEELCDA